MLRPLGLALVCAAAFVPADSARAERPAFQRITPNDGLSSSFVNAILQDRQGFLWFGTNDGLNRYDGYEFRVFRFHPESPGGIGGSFISGLTEDERGGLWIALGAGGVDRFDPATERFTHLTLADEGANPANASLIRATPDAVWIAAATGLWRVPLVDAVAPVTRGWWRRAQEEQVLAASRVQPSGEVGMIEGTTAMAEGAEGELWIGTSSGALYRAGASRVESIDVALRGREITGLEREDDGRLWIATRGAGLLSRDATTGRLERFATEPSDSSISGLVRARDGALWFVSSRGRLHRVEPWSGSDRAFELPGAGRLLALEAAPDSGVVLGTSSGIVFLRGDRTSRAGFDPTDPASLGSNLIPTLAWDRAGGLWAAASGSGVSRLDPHRVRFNSSRGWDGDANPAASQVNAILQEDDGALWLGCTGGLLRFDARGQRTPVDDRALAHAPILSLARGNDGGLWVGTGGGLHRSGRDGRFGLVRRTDTQVAAIVEEPNGIVWYGCGKGLVRFDPRDGSERNYHSDPGDPRSLPSNLVAALVLDAAGELWVGTLVGGFSRYDRASDSFDNYLYAPGVAGGMTNKSIQSLTVASDGAIWLGTYSGGANRFDPATRAFESFTERDGLAGDKVNAIVEDARGRFWLSTNRGLSRLDFPERRFASYHSSDGIQGEEFLPRAATRGPSGEIFFGGVNGLTRFRPEAIERNPDPPPVVLTAFRKFDRSVPLGFAGESCGSVELSYRENFVAFEFAALDFDASRRGQYAYRLDGFDRDWVRCGERRYAAYTNLDPGQYVFRVKAANRDGVWNEAGLTLSLHVRPPFWRTPWFAFLAVLGVGAVLLETHRLRVRVRVRRSLEEERVRSLERERVRAQVARDYHDDVGVQLTRISLYTELVRRELNGSGTPELLSHVGKIAGSVESVVRRTRDFLWSLDRAKSRLGDLAVYLEDQGRSIFPPESVRFEVRGPAAECRDLELGAERKRELSMLFQEAMHNAWKHSGASAVELELRCAGDQLEIELRDDGRGIDDAAPSSSHAGPRGAGAGRGLGNMKVRAAESGGSLVIETLHEGGTRVLYRGRLASPERGIERSPSSR